MFLAYKTTFESEVKIIDSVIMDDFVVWRSEFLDDFIFKPSIDGGVAMIINNRLSYFNSKPNLETSNGSFLIRLDGSKIESGYLSQPSTATFHHNSLIQRIQNKIKSENRFETRDVLYDLRSTELGEVELHSNEMGLKNYYFYNTKLVGFDTIAHRGELENVDWYLHRSNSKFHNHDDYYVSETEWGTPDCTEYPQNMKLRHHRETYVPATKGAEDQGDNVSASKFFRREARARKLINRVQIITSTSRRQTPRRKYAYRYIKDFILQYTCNYGESPSRAFVLTLAVIFGFSLLYPITGVDGLTSVSLDFSSLMSGDVRFYELGTLWESMRFSTATFVTLGLSKFGAETSLTRSLMVSEGLIGSFLVGLFIFSLGRSMKR